METETTTRPEVQSIVLASFWSRKDADRCRDAAHEQFMPVTNAFEVVEDHGRSSVVCRMGVHGVPNRLRPEIYESYRLFCTAFWLGSQR